MNIVPVPNDDCKLIKPNNDSSITSVITFVPDRVQKKLIDAICTSVLASKYANRYDGTYHTQKYSLNFIVTRIIFFIHKCTHWRDLGDGWENIYAHFCKFRDWKIIATTNDVLLEKYKIKRKFNHLKIVMTDSTIILNKGGVDEIKRNPLVKNKNCSKMFNIVDDKGVPLITDFCVGTKHDSVCLTDRLKVFLENNEIKVFMADSGFYSKAIIDLLKAHNVKPLIAKNVRNKKKGKKKKKNKKKEKLTYQQKMERQLEDFTKAEKKLFKKRGKIENVYANYKQIRHFSLRYDKYIKNLAALSMIYFCEQIIKHL